MASLRMSTILFSFCMLCISNHALVAAQLELSIDSFDRDYNCDVGPDALTNAHGKDIPRTCIDVPVGEGSTATTVERCYYTYVPESCMGDENGENPLDLPVVFDIHGLTSCALYSSLYTGWKEKAEEECFVVVWPSGNVNDDLLINGCWNLPAFLRDEGYGTEGGNNVTTAPCCCFKSDDEMGLPSKEPNDPLFLRMAIDSVAESFDMENSSNYYGSISIDRSRVYMAGHSNGCMTSLSMAALHSDVVAAVCCHAGTLLTPFPEQYAPVPIWMAHGLKDDVVRADGVVAFDLGPLFGKLGSWSTNDVLDYIGGRNDCGEAETADIGESGATYRRTNCTNSADVELVMLYESGHWPYAPLPNSIFSSSVDAPVDTTAMAWEFCSSYSNPQQQGYPSGDDSLENENEIDDEIDDDAGEPVENEKEHKKPESDAVPVDNEDANNAKAVEDNEEAMDPLLSSAPRWRSMHEDGTILSATVMTLVLVLGCLV